MAREWQQTNDWSIERTSFTLLFDKDFKKDLAKLDQNVQNKILKKVLELEKSPQLGKHLIGIDLWSLRIGKYRVLYKIKQKELCVLVLTVQHRKEVYDRL